MFTSPDSVVVAFVIAWIVITAIPSVDAALGWLIIAIADEISLITSKRQSSRLAPVSAGCSKNLRKLEPLSD